MRIVFLFSVVMVLYSFTDTQARFCGVPCSRRGDCNNQQLIGYSSCGTCSCSDKFIVSCPRPIPCERGCDLTIRKGCHTCVCFR